MTTTPSVLPIRGTYSHVQWPPAGKQSKRPEAKRRGWPLIVGAFAILAVLAGIGLIGRDDTPPPNPVRSEVSTQAPTLHTP